jgi:hypothetical protein
VDKGSFKKVTELHTVKTFFELVGVEVLDPDLVGLLVSIWNYQSLPNNIRISEYLPFSFITTHWQPVLAYSKQVEEDQAFFALVGFGPKEKISAAFRMKSPLRS